MSSGDDPGHVVTHTVLSCFSGIGGLDLGLEVAGFHTVGCLEIDADARASLVANRPDWTLTNPADVVKAGLTLKPSDLGLAVGELSLIAGGPPCQPFSKAAQWSAPKRGVNDERGQTVNGMMDLIASFLPAAVMMENVSGFLSGRYNARQIIQQRFAEINARTGSSYQLHSWVVDAADYGVPQHRRRAIVIALRDGGALPASLPTTHRGEHRTAWDALGRAADVEGAALSGKYADLLPSIPAGQNYQYLTSKGGGPEVFGYRTRYWSFLLKLAMDKPAWTLPASPGPSTGPFHWDNRLLTSEERLLLQGFPGSWKLAGRPRADMRLTGNATPPPLAEATGRMILNALAGRALGDSITPTLATCRRPAPTPTPPAPAALPARWRDYVGPKTAHPGAGAGPSGYQLARETEI